MGGGFGGQCLQWGSRMSPLSLYKFSRSNVIILLRIIAIIFSDIEAFLLQDIKKISFLNNFYATRAHCTVTAIERVNKS